MLNCNKNFHKHFPQAYNLISGDIKKVGKHQHWFHFHTLTHISFDNGFRKLRRFGFCFKGFFIMIDIPSDIKGLLKSMTRSRSEVIVIDATAISASCRTNSPTIPSHPPGAFTFSDPYFPSFTIRISSFLFEVVSEVKSFFIFYGVR